MLHVLATDGDGSWVIELVKASPGLAVAVVLVVVFLKALAKRDETISAVANACHTQQQAATAAIKENSIALGRVSESLDNQRQLVRDAVRDGLDAAKIKAA